MDCLYNHLSKEICGDQNCTNSLCFRIFICLWLSYDFMDPPSRAMPLKPVMDLNAGSDEVESISVSQSDTFIAACCDKKYVLVWNRKTSDSKPRQIAHGTKYFTFIKRWIIKVSLWEGLTCRSCEFHGEDLIVLACDRKNHRSYLIKFDVAKNKVLR